MIRIECIQDNDSFLALEKEWSDLLETIQNDNIFLTFEWMSKWWKYFGGKRQLYVVVVRNSSEKVIGVSPLFLELPKKGGFFRTTALAFIGTKHSDYLNFISAKEDKYDVISATFQFLLTQRGMWDLVNLRDMPAGSLLGKHVCDMFADEAIKQRKIVRTYCPYCHLPDSWEKYLNFLKDNGRDQRKYFLRRYRRACREFEFSFDYVRDPGSLDDKMNMLFDLHQKVWKLRELPGDFEQTKERAFHLDISKAFLKKGWLRLYYLSLNRQTVALLYGFVYRSKFYYYQSGFDPNWSRYSVGVILMGCCIRACIEEGLIEFDFGRGDEPYKRDWTKHKRPNYHLTIFNSNAKGSMKYQITKLEDLVRGVLPKSKIMRKILKPMRKVMGG